LIITLLQPHVSTATPTATSAKLGGSAAAAEAGRVSARMTVSDSITRRHRTQPALRNADKTFVGKASAQLDRAAS
jgi:hypothetical protein